MGIKRSVDLNEETYQALKKLSASQHITTSALIRQYIEKGMLVDKTSADIDFIRKNIREEIDNSVKGYFNRIIRLHVKVGLMTISMCYFTAKLLYSVKFKGDFNLDEMMEDARGNALSYLKFNDKEIEEEMLRYLHH